MLNFLFLLTNVIIKSFDDEINFLKLEPTLYGLEFLSRLPRRRENLQFPDAVDRLQGVLGQEQFVVITFLPFAL